MQPYPRSPPLLILIVIVIFVFVFVFVLIVVFVIFGRPLVVSLQARILPSHLPTAPSSLSL
jgi:hypothetical protein